MVLIETLANYRGSECTQKLQLIVCPKDWHILNLENDSLKFRKDIRKKTFLAFFAIPTQHTQNFEHVHILAVCFP